MAKICGWLWHPKPCASAPNSSDAHGGSWLGWAAWDWQSWGSPTGAVSHPAEVMHARWWSSHQGVFHPSWQLEPTPK